MDKKTQKRCPRKKKTRQRKKKKYNKGKLQAVQLYSFQR
jgi:hypothetical protein